MTPRRRGILTFFIGTFVGLIPFVLHTNVSPGFDGDSQIQQLPKFTIKNVVEDQLHGNNNPRQKIMLDCGANTASTVEFFRNTYPGGRDFIIHSFEIDERLVPYFHSYPRLHLHCPVGVAAENGFRKVYTESAWSPDRGLNNDRDMQWGGGTFFLFEDEMKDDVTGGKRKLSVRPIIPTIDLSSWIQHNTHKEDYVILKLDVEGAEFDILRKMLKDGTFEWIDKFYGEFHTWQTIHGWTDQDKKKMIEIDIKKSGLEMMDWEAETRNYDDFKELHPVQVPQTEAGKAGYMYSSCGQSSNKVALTIAVGMNAKRARKIISILEAYEVIIPVTLFVYGDFAELFPDDVKNWANQFDIGVREDGYFPSGHFNQLDLNLVEESLVSAELRLQEINIQPTYYLPVNATTKIAINAWKRGFRVIIPAADFPPKEGFILEEVNYYKFRDVERIPKALRLLDDRLAQVHGGVLTLDTDLPDTRLILVFLLDYLVQTSKYQLVSVTDCVSSSDGCAGNCPHNERRKRGRRGGF